MPKNTFAEEEYSIANTANPGSFVSNDNHILQSSLWRDFQKSLNKKVIEVDKSTFSFLAIAEMTPLGKYLYAPYGPYLANSDCFRDSIKSLKQIAKQNNAIFIRIEPTLYLPSSLLRKYGAVKVKDLNPAETWIVEVPVSKEELLKKIPRRLRGYYNSYRKKGIEILKSHNPEDIKYLSTMQRAIFEDKNIKPYPEEYLKAELSQDFATLYMARYEKQIIAAVLVFDDDSTRYYMQAASDKSFSKLNANGILTVEALIDAQKLELNFFDFWGIAPDGASKEHPWYGFTAYKKSFKGEMRVYSGTYDIPVKHFRYCTYSLLRFIKNKTRSKL